jgi:uncharacterized membrane protein YphA (DoxX/SURF4 family)/thiol-disulfide isomerase/thioredoxin
MMAYHPIMDSLILGLRAMLIAVFLTAGVAKLLDRTGSRRALEDFGVPERLARPGAVLLPLGELAIAAALAFPSTARWGALGATVLLGVFVVVIANALAHGRAPDCHCFGQLSTEPAGWGTLARNGLLIAVAVTVVTGGPGPTFPGWLGDRTGPELAMVAAGLIGLALLGFLVRRWKRRRERRVYAAGIVAQMEARQRTPGLDVGSPAPPFTVRGVRGERFTLEGLLARGLPIIFLFVHPRCGPCRELIPHLSRWQATLAGRLTIAILSEGGVAANRSLQEEYGLRDLAVQRHSEVYEAYGANGTPSATVIDRNGRIAGPMVGGQIVIEELIRLALRTDQDKHPSPVG